MCEPSRMCKQAHRRRLIEHSWGVRSFERASRVPLEFCHTLSKGAPLQQKKANYNHYSGCTIMYSRAIVETNTTMSKGFLSFVALTHRPLYTTKTSESLFLLLLRLLLRRSTTAGSRRRRRRIDVHLRSRRASPWRHARTPHQSRRGRRGKRHSHRNRRRRRLVSVLHLRHERKVQRFEPVQDD